MHDASQEIPGSAGTTNMFNLMAGQVEISFKLGNTGDDGKLRIMK